MSKGKYIWSCQWCGYLHRVWTKITGSIKCMGCGEMNYIEKDDY